MSDIKKKKRSCTNKIGNLRSLGYFYREILPRDDLRENIFQDGRYEVRGPTVLDAISRWE